MQKYSKPVTLNLGDLQPALGQCTNGFSARRGPYSECVNGDGATSPAGSCHPGNYVTGVQCAVGNFASKACNSGTSPN